MPRRIEVMGAPFPTSIQFGIELVNVTVHDATSNGTEQRKRFNFVWSVIERNSGRKIPLNTGAETTLSAWNCATPEEWAEWFRDCALQGLEHELSEQILINGERVLDPHAKADR